MTLRSLPLIAALVPLAGVFWAYQIATSAGLIPSCVPFLDGCTSISATGRYPPANLVFRAVELPLASLLFVIWMLSVNWLRQLGNPAPVLGRVIAVAGGIGALALVVYVTFLGTSQPFYEFMRRFGIYFYFLGTAIAQLGVAWGLAATVTTWRGRQVQVRALQALATLPFVLGIANLVLKPLLEDPDPTENSIEWIAALSMQLYYLVLWLAWRGSGFAISVRTERG